MVIDSISLKTSKKTHDDKKHGRVEKNKKFERLFKLEHVTAIISDCFWYIICMMKEEEKYDEHQEMLLDKIATNYVSFTLHEEFIGQKNQ